MAKNSNLIAAKKTKNDEFYTQLTDIEKELVHYHNQLRGKVIFCNCDDPEWSNFWRYFDLNFDHIGIKALISTHFDPEKPSYKSEIRRDEVTGEKLPPMRTDLRQNGDFRSNECVEQLRRCDVVVTNPPFSLFRSYVAQLMQYRKKFIIIGNMNAITYKEIFPLLKGNLMWLGYMNPKQFKQIDGTMKLFGNVLWSTNIDIKKRHEPLTLFRRYADDPSKYPKYNNYDGINVDRTVDIPFDYYGIMGVPLSYLCVHCPDQFEIVGAGTSRDFFTPTIKYVSPLRHNPDGSVTRQHIAVNQTVTLGHDAPPSKGFYCTALNTKKYLTSPYNRILIRRKI